ncbi:hypothetical protein NE237_025017 [Protea cynaroides]|uniref:Uncharacterized protein n=1 Tax=Protea cynaroides TaxID=273540 RepID=A0A9Q0H111_9MAGN|nr:hypothetical protein NE237_025017 [Protea cynaroides]
MASAFVTLAKPFSFNKTIPSFSNQRSPVLRSNTLRINAVATKWEPTKVVPQADRVLIRLEELPEKSAGGVLLPKSSVKFERYLMGEVLSVGAEVSNVEAGKKVLLSDINAYPVDLGTDAKHCFCQAGELLAVVEARVLGLFVYQPTLIPYYFLSVQVHSVGHGIGLRISVSRGSALAADPDLSDPYNLAHEV